jgi:hypothetical protein
VNAPRPGAFPTRAAGGALALAASVLSACASTTIETTGTALDAPFCRVGAPATPTVVTWGAKWRPDQKEPERREAAAARGLDAFLAETRCIEVEGVERFRGPPPPDDELLRTAAAAHPSAARAVLVVVRELGPWLLIGLPVPVRGGTEVVVEVRVLDVPRKRKLADARTHWRNGGAFVVKGVASLERDLGAALRAALRLDPPAG